MSNSPIICGIIGKKLYLTILLAITFVSYSIIKKLIPLKHNIPLINDLGGSVFVMLSVFIPRIFKFKGKSKNSSKKCTKTNFKDYFIFFLIIILQLGLHIILAYFNIYYIIINFMYVGLCLQMNIIYYFIDNNFKSKILYS